jgi:hypothetical protein
MVSLMISALLILTTQDEIPPESRYPNLSKKLKIDGKYLRQSFPNFVGRILQPSEITELSKRLNIAEPKPLNNVTSTWAIILPRTVSIPGIENIYLIEGTSNACIFHCQRSIPVVTGNEGMVFLTGNWKAQPQAYYSGRFLQWESAKQRKLSLEERVSLTYFLGFASELPQVQSRPAVLISFSNEVSKATINDRGVMSIGSVRGQLEHVEWAQLCRVFNLIRNQGF